MKQENKTAGFGLWEQKWVNLANIYQTNFKFSMLAPYRGYIQGKLSTIDILIEVCKILDLFPFLVIFH